jgi:hypothetical protein
VTCYSDLLAIDRDLMEVLSRSYLTAVTILGDPAGAEALVIEAVQGLDALWS